MSSYERYPYRRQSISPVWLVLLVLILAGILAYRFWPGAAADFTADAVPREVTARGDLASDEKSTIELYHKVSPSVVHITNIAMRGDFFDLNVQKVAKGTGSGFVWSKDGLVVTNFHVVQGADAMEVVLPDKARTKFETRSWMSYPDRDLAVLYIKAPPSKLEPIEIGTSHDLEIGQKAFAIGNPFGLDQTLTTGIVSALGREIESATGRPIQGVIQTSAAINPGNSGGPLLDSAGRLIGVNTAILSPSGTFAGIGFAIPVDEVNRVVPTLIAALNKNRGKGEISPPRLGVRVAQDQLAHELGVNEGVLVIQVIPDSPAAKAGLHPTHRDQGNGQISLGDVIVAVNDNPVKTSKDLNTALETHQVGDEVTLTILRNGQEQKVKITLAAVTL